MLSVSMHQPAEATAARTRHSNRPGYFGTLRFVSPDLRQDVTIHTTDARARAMELAFRDPEAVLAALTGQETDR